MISLFSMDTKANSLRRPRVSAFTLPELMVVMVIFTLLVTTLVACQIFGMRIHRIAETKLAATASGRKALNQVREEVREAKLIFVGNGDNTLFTKIPDNTAHIGNALQVCPTTNQTVFTRFYLDSTDHCLKRISSTNNKPWIVATHVTNQLVFRAEDFRGNVLTNDRNSRVIRMTLELYQWEYPIASAGPGGMYDYYRLQTRITRRLID